MPHGLESVATASLVVAGLCTLVIGWDVARQPQRMWIMNVVWPVTALYAGPLALYGYFTVGRLSTAERVAAAKRRHEMPPGERKPFWQMTALAATHCGSGCTLGDIVAEWFVFAVPITILGHGIFGAWALDYALALLFGIAFQYFTIRPMGDLSVADGLVRAVKADFLSLTSWQVGMYGWMAIVTFGIVGHEMEKTSPVFWFMMQIAMLAGFVTAYPVNWLLLEKGIKEPM